MSLDPLFVEYHKLVRTNLYIISSTGAIRNNKSVKSMNSYETRYICTQKERCLFQILNISFLENGREVWSNVRIQGKGNGI